MAQPYSSGRHKPNGLLHLGAPTAVPYGFYPTSVRNGRGRRPRRPEKQKRPRDFSRGLGLEPSELNKVTLKGMLERTSCRLRCHQHRFLSKCVRLHLFEYCRSSPRSISTVKLKTSPSLHTQPINHVVFVGSYLITQWDILS